MKKLLKIFDPECTKCKMHQEATDVCRPGFVQHDRKVQVVVVSRMPNSDTYQDQLRSDLGEAGLPADDFYYTAAIKCRNFEQDPSNGDVKTCRGYLDQELALLEPDWILALGNEALLASTGHSGIMKYRGRVIEKQGHSVFPTVSPASVARNPGQKPAYMADLRLFGAHLFEKSSKVPPAKVLFVDNKEKVKQLIGLLDRADLLSYDIETNGGDEFRPEARIVSLSGTMEIGSKVITWALPLYHPESPWRKVWRSLLVQLAPHLVKPKKQIAHNGKFDARWLRQFGVPAKVTFDTMLCAHILDENRQKGLKPQAASRLGVAPWAMDTKNLLSEPLRDVLKYNALDTYYTYHIYQDMRAELIAQPRLARVFTKLTMPANEIYIDTERRGVWIDVERLAERRKKALDFVDEFDRQLMEYVPEPGSEGWPTYKSGKPVPVNFNPSIFSRWLLFEELGLPVLGRGKKKDDGRLGDPSMAEAIMLALKDEHPIVEILLKRSNWVKTAQFLEAYDEIKDENDRIHTTFKLAGTVTGRTSSGKVDEEKVTGRAPTRGVNLQQVPRDAFVRGLFGAAPGYTFVEADFSQVELRIVAFLSRDRTMLRLYQTGQDIHRATAANVLGIPPSQVTKDDRKKAKAVNFGFVYGMGAKKFVMTAFEKYELVVSLDEAQAVRKAFFQQFSGLQPWHAKQRRLVHQYGRVANPIGRIRHLPDIRSQDEAVVAEAERQAINSPVQSFGSDMMLLALQLIKLEFTQRGWDYDAFIIGSVHDAGLFEVRTELIPKALPVIKRCMEGALVDALRRKFAVDLDVPIVADLKVGSHWGDAAEVPEELFSGTFWPSRLRKWLKENGVAC